MLATSIPILNFQLPEKFHNDRVAFFRNDMFSSKAFLKSVSITECDANVTFKTKAVTRRFPDRLETIRSDCDQMNRLLDVFSFARDETANVLDQLNNFY